MARSTSSPSSATRYVDDVDVDGDLVSFVACFRGPVPESEREFEALLWGALQHLHDRDAEPWAEGVAAEPENPHFAFSVAGTAFFVVGLHPAASRVARRAPVPTLVFNLHEQFERIREDGRYQRMRDTIRRRDTELQGSLNPMVSDHGETSEARQYAGRAVPPGWTPPFEPGPGRRRRRGRPVNPARRRFPRHGEPLGTRGSHDRPVRAGPGSLPRPAPTCGSDPGDRLTVLDPCGEQVSDLYLVAVDDPPRSSPPVAPPTTATRSTCPPRSLLWSNRSRVLAEVVEDTVGVHDLTLRRAARTPSTSSTRARWRPVPRASPTSSRPGSHGVDSTGSAPPSTSSWTCGPTTAASCTSTHPPPAPGDRFASRARMR